MVQPAIEQSRIEQANRQWNDLQHKFQNKHKLKENHESNPEDSFHRKAFQHTQNEYEVQRNQWEQRFQDVLDSGVQFEEGYISPNENR